MTDGSSSGRTTTSGNVGSWSEIAAGVAVSGCCAKPLGGINVSRASVPIQTVERIAISGIQLTARPDEYSPNNRIDRYYREALAVR